MHHYPHVFLSNRIERLYIHLKKSLFQSSHPFARRIVIVPSPQMKSWLMMEMAKDSALGIATGIETGYLDYSLEKLVKFFSTNSEQQSPPSTLEMAFILEVELRKLLHQVSNTNTTSLWEPLLRYLQVNSKDNKLSRKSEKRLIALAEKMASLFADYGKYGGKMLKEWQSQESDNWQQLLWKLLEVKCSPWNYPYRQLESFAFNKAIKGEISVHLFALSYISPLQHRFLLKLGQHIPVYYYTLSPCKEFWSDLVSHKEGMRLKNYWKGRGVSLNQQTDLENYLFDSNPLLANCGRLGRNMAEQIEKSDLPTTEDYINPKDFEETGTLLEAVQTDLVLLRNPEKEAKISFNRFDESIQVHQVSRPLQEVEVIYNAILRILDEHAKSQSPIEASDILVMAPNIANYHSYIKTVFGSQESLLDFHVMDLQMLTHSSMVQSFLHLLKISFGRWDVLSILKLFDCRYFQIRHQLSAEDIQQIHLWVKEAGIKWGKNQQHRNEMLKRDYCVNEMLGEEVGTWEYGLGRLLAALAMFSDQEGLTHLDAPFPSIHLLETAQGDLLGKFIRLLQSLLSDLKPLNGSVFLTLKEWTSYLKCLLEAYFLVPSTDEEAESYKILIRQIETFIEACKTIGEEKFSFLSIHKHLEALLSNQMMSSRESALNAVKFCSLLPMRCVPAKVIVLLGMQEGVFPRQDRHFSLNLLIGNSQADYFPTPAEFDRYLFLEVLLSARKYFIITYVGNQQESLPSLLVSELLSYLDQAYVVQEGKPSTICLYQHPFLSFDQMYFRNDFRFQNFSKAHYKAAQAYYQKEKKGPPQFISEFSIDSPKYEAAQEPVLNLKDLISFARDPVKAYFNKVLGIYLDKEEEDWSLKREELFQSSHLQQAILTKKALTKPLKQVLKMAAKEGQLPLGPFREININKITHEVEKHNANLARAGAINNDYFEIECSQSCQKPIRLENGSWKVPPLLIILEDKRCIQVVGKLTDVSPQGLIGYIKEDPVEVAKIWPILVVFSHLVQKHNLPIPRQLICVKDGKTRGLDFENAEKLLAQYLEYYFIGMNNISPLIPNWIPSLLSLSPEAFGKGVINQWKNPQSPLYNDYLEWLFSSTFPNTQSIVDNWKEVAQKVFSGPYMEWFPRLKSEGEDDTLL